MDVIIIMVTSVAVSFVEQLVCEMENTLNLTHSGK